MKKSMLIFLVMFSSAFCFLSQAKESMDLPRPTVNVGVLKFGTVNWLIDVIKHHHLDDKYGFKLEVTGLASKNASTLALQSNAVDVIVSDWLWVNRQRFEQRLYTLAPTSMVSGGVYVAKHAKIKTIADLATKKIGIAGGSVDKNWLLFQAYSKKVYGMDVKNELQAVFMVPPLLNKLMMRGELAAAINFWHYGARLKAAGFKTLVTVSQMLAALGINKQPPLLGWVFDETWAKQNKQAISGFLAAAKQANEILHRSDDEWIRIRPLLKAKNEQVFTALKADYRAGSLSKFTEEERIASEQLFHILAEQGGHALVGKATHLDNGTFWQSSQ